MPDGVGSAAEVVVSTAGGLTSESQADPVTVSYSPPVILAVVPHVIVMPPDWANASVRVEVELAGLDHDTGFERRETPDEPPVLLRVTADSGGLDVPCTALRRLPDSMDHT